jgi:hypothetical protein
MLDASTGKVAREIVRYFLHHPAATDSLEGIARWRLMLQRIDESANETAEALRVLVEAGIMQEIRTPDGQLLYRLNADKREAADELLKSDKERPE